MNFCFNTKQQQQQKYRRGKDEVAAAAAASYLCCARGEDTCIMYKLTADINCLLSTNYLHQPLGELC